jgi:exodeoxyribonuclease-5
MIRSNSSFEDEIVLCATARLARTLPLEVAARAQVGEAGVPVPRTATITQWLGEIVEEALLCGEVQPEALPKRVLSAQAEQLLWERCVRAALDDEVASALFDARGLAAEAMKAAELVDVWELAVDPAQGSEETRRFLEWRQRFIEDCTRHGWATSAMVARRQVELLADGVGRLPSSVALAGFDRLNPLEQRLVRALEQRGVTVREHVTGIETAAATKLFALSEGTAECRAAVHWAVELMLSRPEARVGIAVPDLAARRTLLTRLLDHALDVAALRPSQAQRQRHYNLSLGLPLAEVPMVATALALLRLTTRRDFPQQDFGSLLNSPWWASDLSEAEARARFDALMRERLPVRCTLARIVRLARKAIVDGLVIHSLTDRLEHVVRLLDRLPPRQVPSAWRASLLRVLEAFGWPGERGLSSHDFQAREAFVEVLDSLAGLDDITGALSQGEAVARLAEGCAAHLFQPRTEGRPRIQVLGLLEAAGERLDALWVMGMNDAMWPPAPNPSPLLPAALQRAARTPNASAEVQFEFARAIHARLLQAAPELVFSHALREGESELRPSPLVLSMVPQPVVPALAFTLGEQVRAAAAATRFEYLDDHLAPPVAEGEKVAGGTGLFRTQAICPAWAFYRHRLGAQPLETPTEGLDARERGSLVHKVLECFWRERDLDGVQTMDEATLGQAIAGAVAGAIAQFNEQREAPLTPRFLELERDRLVDLLGEWVAHELQRGMPFAVRACEQERIVEVGGIAVRLIVDRIDELADGSLLMIDYKTSTTIDASSWAAERITEPQLPIYASFATEGEPVSGIALARVRLAGARFAGVTAEDGLLPGVKGLASARSLYDETVAPDWGALLARWRNGLTALAAEIRAGEAAVRFTREQDLAWCEVAPILRLPERRLLYGRLLAQAASGDGR